MRVRTTLEFLPDLVSTPPQVLFERETDVDGAAAAMDAALSCVAPAEDGTLTLRSVAIIEYDTGASTTMADLRRGGWRARNWRSTPKHIALDLQRLAKRVAR